MTARCENCVHWELANAAPRLGGRIEPWEVDDLDPKYDAEKIRWMRLPHANLNWAKCTLALEGWEDEFDFTKHKMAVWDGSRYLAQLLTRCDHVCGEHSPRSPEAGAE